jgi:hypothetical protein
VCVCRCIGTHRRIFWHIKLKKTLTAYRNPLVHCGETFSDVTVWVYHFRRVKQIEPKFVAATIFHLSSLMIDNVWWSDSLHFHFYWFIPKDHKKWNIQRPLPVRKTIQQWEWTENAVRKSGNLIQVSLICLTRPYLPKLLFTFRYTIHTNQYLYYSLDTVLNTEIQYSTKRSHLRKN